MAVAKIQRASGGQVVYSELKRQILNLELTPGQRLYEPELARQMQVSRTPLREALRLLIAEDLLEQLSTGGVVVPVLAVREIEELYTVRAALEGLQAREATLKATGAELAELAGIVERNALLVSYPTDAMDLGHSFHALIGTIADNAWASRLHGQIDGHMSRYRTYTNRTQARREAALGEHQTILEALIARDPDRAGHLARDHALAAREEAIRAIGGRLDAETGS